jgi:hypothetical protein
MTTFEINFGTNAKSFQLSPLMPSFVGLNKCLNNTKYYKVLKGVKGSEKQTFSINNKQKERRIRKT